MNRLPAFLFDRSKYQMSLFTVKIVSLALTGVIVSCLVGPKPAHAYIAPFSPDPGRNVGIPAGLYDYLANCDAGSQSPAFVTWISAAPPNGGPVTTTLTVNYGTPSVQLEYHLAAVVCKPNSAVTDTGDRVEAAFPAGVSGIAGVELYRNYSPHNQVGLYRHTSRVFTYAPPGGFTASADHVITIRGHGINRFTSGVYLCTIDGANAGGGFNFGNCATEDAGFLVRVNVNPAPLTTITGRVFAHPDQLGGGGYANLGIEICDGDGSPDAFTNASGVFTVQIPQGTGFCLRVVGAPPGTIGGPYVRPVGEGIYYRDPPGYPTFTGQVRDRCNVSFGASAANPLVQGRHWEADGLPDFQAPEPPSEPSEGQGNYNYCPTQWSYEWQVAGADAFNNGAYGFDYSVYDRALDTGYDFVFRAPPPVRNPYLTVFGGDIHAGANLSTGTSSGSCVSPDSTSRIRGQRADGNSGSRDQYGVGATAQIEQFGSAGQVSGNAATFGNTPSDGNFYRTICRPDFTQLAHSQTISGDTHSIADFAPYSGQVVLWTGTGNKLLTGGTLNAGQRVTIITLGTVRISGNIRYLNTDTPSYNDVDDIPAFMLVSDRNIVIESGVSSLTGYYIANEALSTCTNSFSNIFNPNIQGSGGATCATPLRIYGAVAAGDIYLRRTSGTASASDETLGGDLANAAELVLMIPELYLASPPGLSSQSGLKSFLGDLPPVF